MVMQMALGEGSWLVMNYKLLKELTLDVVVLHGTITFLYDYIVKSIILRFYRGAIFH